jgi:hypothetical protein
MTSYYLFQKKIENVFKYNNSSLNNNYYLSEWKIDKLYVLDYDWIRRWKVNSRYNDIKSELDNIYSNTNRSDLIKYIILNL